MREVADPLHRFMVGRGTFSVLLLPDRAGKGNTSFMSGLSGTGARGEGEEGEEGEEERTGEDRWLVLWLPLRSPFVADNGVRICRRSLRHFLPLFRAPLRDSSLFAFELVQNGIRLELRRVDILQ